MLGEPFDLSYRATSSRSWSGRLNQLHGARAGVLSAAYLALTKAGSFLLESRVQPFGVAALAATSFRVRAAVRAIRTRCLREASSGKLSVIDPGTRLEGGGVVQNAVRTAASGNIDFKVAWTAPAAAGGVDFTAWGNSVNGDRRRQNRRRDRGHEVLH